MSTTNLHITLSRSLAESTQGRGAGQRYLRFCALPLILLGVLALTGCPEESKPEQAFFVKVDNETPTQIYELAMDSESLAAVTERLGYAPNGIGSLGARENGEMTIRFDLSPDAQTSFVDQFFTYQAGGGTAPKDFAILIDGGTTAIGLLLPAVQNARASGAHRDKDEFLQLFFEVGGIDGTIEEWSAPLPEPQPKVDSFFDITTEFESVPSSNPAEKALIEAARGPFAVLIAAFGQANQDGTVPTEDLALHFIGAAVEDLADQSVPMAGIIEVLAPDGRPVVRISALDALLVINYINGTAALEGGDAQVITYTGLENASTDTDAQIALFASDYTSYDSTAVDTAARKILTLKDALLVSGKDALLAWHGGLDDDGSPIAEIKTATVANLVETVINAAVSENLACTMATPDMLKAGKDPAINGGLNRDIIRRTAGRMALAATIAPHPSRYTLDTKKLLVSSLGETPEPDSGSTSAQCDALASLAAVIVLSDVNLSTIPTSTQTHLEEMGRALTVQRAAYLDRLVFEFVEHMNSRLPTDVGSDEEWTTAAKTKADILIESLGNEATNGPLMQAAAKELLGQ